MWGCFPQKLDSIYDAPPPTKISLQSAPTPSLSLPYPQPIGISAQLNYLRSYPSRQIKSLCSVSLICTYSRQYLWENQTGCHGWTHIIWTKLYSMNNCLKISIGTLTKVWVNWGCSAALPMGWPFMPWMHNMYRTPELYLGYMNLKAGSSIPTDISQKSPTGIKLLLTPLAQF